MRESRVAFGSFYFSIHISCSSCLLALCSADDDDDDVHDESDDDDDEI